MDIKQLITFRTLAQEKNYMKTSEKLSYAPSTLAKHIRSLEDELQVQLVEYRSGKIELTYDGKRFMRYADEMLSVYFKLQYEFDQTKSAIGTIRVAGGELMVGFAFRRFLCGSGEDSAGADAAGQRDLLCTGTGMAESERSGYRICADAQHSGKRRTADRSFV